jgi:hypothetical protein
MLNALAPSAELQAAARLADERTKVCLLPPRRSTVEHKRPGQSSALRTASSKRFSLAGDRDSPLTRIATDPDASRDH